MGVGNSSSYSNGPISNFDITICIDSCIFIGADFFWSSKPEFYIVYSQNNNLTWVSIKIAKFKLICSLHISAVKQNK